MNTKTKKGFCSFVLAVFFCITLFVMPGCLGGDGNSDPGSENLSTPVLEENIRATDLPPVEDGELGGNARLYFDFRNATQDGEGKTREKSQCPREYLLNSFLKEKIEGVDISLYLQNKEGQYVYYGYWYVSVEDGLGSDDEFLKVGNYRFEVWTFSPYGRSFSAVEYKTIEPNTLNSINLNLQRTSEILIPFCIMNPFGVYSEGEYYNIQKIDKGLSVWDWNAQYRESKLFFSAMSYEPHTSNEIEITIFGESVRIMHSYFDIMDILSGNPIPLQVTEVPTGTATISAEFDFENNAPTINIVSPSQDGPAISASLFSLQGTAYPGELLQITMKNSDGVVLWDAPKLVDTDGTFEIDMPLTKAPLTTAFTVTVEVEYENWPSFPAATVNVNYQPPISITRDDSFPDATSENPTPKEYGLYNLGAYVIKVNRRFNASDFTASTAVPFPLGQHVESLFLVTRDGEFQVGHTVMYPSDDGVTPVAHLFHEDMVLETGEYKFQLYASRKAGAPSSAEFKFQLSASGNVADSAEFFQSGVEIGQNIYLPAIE